MKEGMKMETNVILDTLWVVLAGMLVFFMNAGFGTLESGMCRSKNTVNILSKNFIVFAVSSLGFFLLGWGLMFGDGNGFIGLKGLLFASGADNSPNVGAAYEGVYSAISWAGVPFWVKFFFQLVFCGTAATIVSGAVAERIKYLSFIVFSLILTMLIYPVTGHWIWGGGWLSELGFMDFAGGTAVHAVGGWAALSGIMILGPASASTQNRAKSTPSRATASRSRPSARSSSGSAGSGLTPAPPWRPTPRPSATSSSRRTPPVSWAFSPRRLRRG